MDFMKARLKELSTWNGIVLFVAATIKYFAPDNIDQIVDSVVPLLAVMNMAIPDKKS
jgi:hypothetical protein